MAATFVDINTRKAVRIVAREDAARQELDSASQSNREQALRHAYLSLPDETLFDSQTVQVDMSPEDRPGYHAPRVVCVHCGEGVSFMRYVIQDGTPVCLSCAAALQKQPINRITAIPALKKR